MSACCSWCLTIIKAPDNYNRATMRLYCSVDCCEKDWLFRKWQNDEWLSIRTQRRRS